METDRHISLRSELRKLSEVIGMYPVETLRLRKGERRDVAVLFLDLKDFTALSEGMDHEILFDLLSGVMKTLSNVIESYGGYVDKIQGDSIMALFGARKADENDSIRAVSCGLRMIETMFKANSILDEVDVRFDARVGISFGAVTVAPDPSGHLTAIGDVVNVASRLETMAAVNCVLVSGMVKRHCGDVFEWEDRGLTEIRGRREPVHVYSPTGPGSVQRTRWERASRVARSPLVGRKKEMEFLRDKYRMQASGKPGTNRLGGCRHIIVDVFGEAGIGKSRLVYEFIKELRMDDPFIHLLSGQTLSYAQQPFWLWVTLIQAYFGIVMGDEDAAGKLDRKLEELVNTTGDRTLLDSRQSLASLLSIPVDDSKATSVLDDESRHRETVMAIRNLIQAIGRTGRTVIVLEDLHWMDSASRDALEFLVANSITPGPILFLCLYRPVWEDGIPVVGTVYEDSADTYELELKTVSEQACRELIRHMLDTGLQEDVADFLLSRSGGNPFFLEELILDTIESGVLEEKHGKWSFTSSPESVYIPSTVNSLIRSRIDRLQQEYRGGLQHCSVLGMDFLMRLYRRLHEKVLSEGKPEEIIYELTRRNFLRNINDSREAKFIFRHFLIHDSAYDTLLHRNRRLLHRYAAEAIEELFADVSDDLSPVIAHHWERAGNTEKALLWGMKALETCRRTYQNREGLLWIGKLTAWLDQQPDSADRNDNLLAILQSKQSILGILGRRDEQLEAIEKMFDLIDKFDLSGWSVVVYRARGEFRSIMGQMAEAQSDFEKALEIADEGELAGIYLLMGENYFRQSMYPETLDCYRKVQQSSDDWLMNTRVELSTAFICRLMGLTGEKAKHIETAGRLIRENIEGERPLLEARYYLRLADHEYDNGSSVKSEEYYLKALDLYRKCGDLAGEATVLNNMHWIYSRNGDHGKSLEILMEVARIDQQIGEALGIAIAYYNIAETCMEMNDFEKAREYYSMYLERSAKINNELGEGYGKYGMGNLCMSEGDDGQAESYFRESAAVFGKLGAREMQTIALVTLAELLIDSQRREEAAGVLDTIHSGSFSPEVKGELEYVRGLVELSAPQDERDLTKAADFFRLSVADPDHCDKSGIACRYTRLIETLGKLNREDERKLALAEGSEILEGMLKKIAPEFMDAVVKQNGITEFMALCDAEGYPVRTEQN